MIEEITMAAQRILYTAAQTQASSLRDEDFIQINGRWREIFDVHTDQESLIRLRGQSQGEDLVELADRIRLDGGGREIYRLHRPIGNGKPTILRDKKHAAVLQQDHRTVETRLNLDADALAAALLAQGCYTAVRYVVDERMSADEVPEAWAIFLDWDLVTIQVPHED